jgi:hypothetical protein
MAGLQSRESRESLNQMVFDDAYSVSLAGDDALGSAVYSAIYVGTAGDIKIDTPRATAVLLKNIKAGEVHRIQITKVYSTANGSSATDVVVLR